jgi:hypothetical protein
VGKFGYAGQVSSARQVDPRGIINKTFMDNKYYDYYIYLNKFSLARPRVTVATNNIYFKKNV